MAKGRLRLLGSVPGARNLAPLVAAFLSKSEGTITAFSEAALRTLTALVPGGADVEPMPFGALVSAAALRAGEDPLPLAHSGHFVAAISAACEGLSDDSPFARTAHRPGLHRAMAKTLQELTDWRMGPDRLDELATDASPRLAAKLLDLSQILRESGDLLRVLGRQLSVDHVETCLEISPGADTGFGRIFVLAGDDASPACLEWIRWAVECGSDVTLVVYRHASGAGLFEGSARVAEFFGMAPQPVGEENALLACLFTSSVALPEAPAVALFSAADPLAESEWAVRGCLQAVQQGIDLNKIGIYARNVQGYAPLLESAANRLGLALRVQRRAPLLTNAFARLAQNALRFCASHDVRTLTPILRSTYVGLDHPGRKAALAALREAHRSRSEQWAVLKDWAKSQSEGLSWLLRLLEWRDEAITKPATLADWAGKLRMLVDVLPWHDAFGHARGRDLRAQTALQRALAHTASIDRAREPSSITLAQFSAKADAVWEDTDVSLPPADSGVSVTGSADCLEDLDVLFVMGMLEGVFPRRRSEDPILTDDERDELSLRAGGMPLQTSHMRARRERDEFYSVCAAATAKLVFSYPQTDEQRDNVPAFYLEEVRRAVGNPVETIDHPRPRLAPEEDTCAADADLALAKALKGERVGALTLDLQTDAIRFARSESTEESVTPRELRAALQCPFSHFVRHVLNVRVDRRRNRWSTLRQLPVQASLPIRKTPEEATIALEALLEAELDGMFTDVPEWEISLIRSGGKRLIREWVTREFAARRVWPETETRVNVQFGDAGLRKSVGKGVSLRGSVPAISRIGPYSVIRMFESRPPKIESGKLDDLDALYYGLHLLAAWEQGSAGAIEIESMTDERFLLLLPRMAEAPLPGDAAKGLRTFDIGSDEPGKNSQKEFYNRVKERVRFAAAAIQETQVQAVNGDHCAFCDFGEICRHSFHFGEEESPFGVDRSPF